MVPRAGVFQDTRLTFHFHYSQTSCSVQDMSEIQINKGDFANLQDCKVGEPLTLKGDVTAVDGDTLTLDVTSAEYDETAGQDDNDGDEGGPPAETAAPANPVTKIGVPGGTARSFGSKKSYG